MDAPSRSWFGTLQAAFVLLALSFLVAVPLTWIRYSRSHLENEGVDLVHHLIIAHETGEMSGPDSEILGWVAKYPAASHRLAVWSAPLFGGDRLAALRCVACATMLALLALPFVLLCRVFSPLPALVLLPAWHLACYHLKVSGMNHFMWEQQYNYSRAVGTIGFWMALVALSTAARSPWSRFGVQTLAAVSACLALACHIGPGAVAFGAVLACQAAWWMRERTAARLASFAVTLAAAAGMVFGTSVWVLMAGAAGQDGGLPVGPHAILLIWVPILLAGLVLYFARLRLGFPKGDGGDGVEMALVAGLLAGGLLQAYLTWKMAVNGSVAPYAVKSIYFLTFPVASLLLLRWVGQLPVPNLPRLSVPVCVVAVMLGWLFVSRWNHDDPARHARILTVLDGSVLPPPEELPEAVSRRLLESSDEFADYFYFDPHQINGSYYASMAGLRAPLAQAVQMFLALHEDARRFTPKGREALARAGFVGLVLPESADPAKDAPGMGPAVKCGRFWKCPLPARVVVVQPAQTRR